MQNHRLNASVFFGLSVLLCGLSAQSSPWGLNDVSILYPLPKESADLSQMVKPSDAGPGGILLPLPLVKFLPKVSGGNFGNMKWDEFRLISIRIDPMEFEIRMVWQAPTFSKNKGKYYGSNLGLHTFYKISPMNWGAFIGEMEELKKRFPISVDTPLQVHPVLAKLGFGSEFAQTLKEILLRYCGVVNLTRLSMMDAGPIPKENAFDVGLTRIEVVNGKPVKSHIPGIKNDFQNFRYQFDEEGNLVGMQIDSTHHHFPMSFPAFLNFIWEKPSPMPKLEKIYEATLQADHPGFTSTKTTDCASCHLGTDMRNLMDQNWPEEKSFQKLREKYAFKSPYPLNNLMADPKTSTNVRGFGYIVFEPSAIQRTILDSAVSAAVMTNKTRR